MSYLVADLNQVLLRYRWIVVLLLWFVCFFSYADRQAFYSVFPLLQEQMHLSTFQLGVLGSSFAIVYGIAGPFAGFLVDRIRRKTAILGGLEFWSVICVLSALSRTFLQLFVFRAAQGLGESIYYPAALSMVSDYHGSRTRSRAMGLLQTSVYAGTIGGGYWAGVLAQRYGWRFAVFLFGALGCFLGLILIAILREPARGSAEREDALGRNQINTGVSRHSLRKGASLLRRKSLLALTGAFACANFVAMAVLSWMPLYLYSRFHLSLSMAAFDAAVFPQIASIVGAVCGGFIADTLVSTNSRGRVLMQSAGVFAGAPFIVICGLGKSLILVIAALVFWGFFKGIYDSNIFASAFDVVPPESRGTVSGLMNCVGWLLGGGIAPAVIGYLATRFALGTAIAFSATFYILAGLLLASIARRTLVADIQQVQCL